MESWQREIDELHEFFEAYFLGTIDAAETGRLEASLAPDFTFIGPDGAEADRAGTIAAVTGGHAHTSSLKITITDARLLVDSSDVVICRYVENHELADRTNHRVSTVVFSKDADGSNGLKWRAVHETWLPGGGH